jgi:hypothetical protein
MNEEYQMKNINRVSKHTSMIKLSQSVLEKMSIAIDIFANYSFSVSYYYDKYFFFDLYFRKISSGNEFKHAVPLREWHVFFSYDKSKIHSLILPNFKDPDMYYSTNHEKIYTNYAQKIIGQYYEKNDSAENREYLISEEFINYYDLSLFDFKESNFIDERWNYRKTFLKYVLSLIIRSWDNYNEQVYKKYHSLEWCEKMCFIEIMRKKIKERNEKISRTNLHKEILKLIDPKLIDIFSPAVEIKMYSLCLNKKLVDVNMVFMK